MSTQLPRFCRFGDNHVELHAFDSSYGDRFGFGGLQVRVVLEPFDQLVGGGHRLYLPLSAPRLVDSLQLPEVEEGDLCFRNFLKNR